MAEISMRELMESRSYLMQKEALNKEINSQVIVIDYECFKKNQAEKDRLKDMKEDNRIARRKHYGENYKKFLNIPALSIGDMKIEGFIVPAGIILTGKSESKTININ